VIVTETTDIDEIREVMCHPEIYPCISDDNSYKSIDFVPPMNVTYLAGYIDGMVIGLFIIDSTETNITVHIQVIPEFRQLYAKEFARMALQFGEVKNAVIYSEIPVCYQNVMRFAKSFGFEEYGLIKGDCFKDGILYDTIILRLDNGIH